MQGVILRHNHYYLVSKPLSQIPYLLLSLYSVIFVQSFSPSLCHPPLPSASPPPFFCFLYSLSCCNLHFKNDFTSAFSSSSFEFRLSVTLCCCFLFSSSHYSFSLFFCLALFTLYSEFRLTHHKCNVLSLVLTPRKHASLSISLPSIFSFQSVLSPPCLLPQRRAHEPPQQTDFNCPLTVAPFFSPEVYTPRKYVSVGHVLCFRERKTEKLRSSVGPECVSCVRVCAEWIPATCQLVDCSPEIAPISVSLSVFMDM